MNRKKVLYFNNPIPSCKIYELKFEDKKWQFGYLVESNFDLDEEFKNVYIYGNVCGLYLESANMPNGSVNIQVSSMEEYIKYLELQRKLDLLFRKTWIMENPDETPIRIRLHKRTYSNRELAELDIKYISSIFKKEHSFTVFTGSGAQPPIKGDIEDETNKTVERWWNE